MAVLPSLPPAVKGTAIGDGSAPRLRVETSDVVVVGAGLAGLTAALGLSPRRVRVLSKAPIRYAPQAGTTQGEAIGAGGSSVWAQGGVAAAVGTGDSPRLHAADTLAAGAGLTDAGMAALLTAEGRERVRMLVEMGVRFDRGEDGELALGQEGAHSVRRVLHANGDATGAEIVRALMASLAAAPGVELCGGVTALELVTLPADAQVSLTRQGAKHAAVEKSPVHLAGVLARHDDGTLVLHQAPAVVLATGGLGRLYLHTTNPPENTGDGLAMAARAGARLADLEFVQFHPTALAVDDVDPLPLLTEALRGEGAILVDAQGERFMLDEHPLAELAPRDVVARAIHRRREAGQEIYLDAREAVGEAFPRRFPTVFELCRRHGLDPRYEQLPVSPAAHFHMGGIATDEHGRSSLDGLWACGEVACTGVHGANRLASNSLLEALVFGQRVALDITGHLEAAELDAPGLLAGEKQVGTRRRIDGETVLARASQLAVAYARQLAPEVEALWIGEIRRLAWQQLGLVRDETGLRSALASYGRMVWDLPEGSVTARNLLTLARLLANAALARCESRGGHYRSDFPRADAAWRYRLYHGSERLVSGEAQQVVADAGVAEPCLQEPGIHPAAGREAGAARAALLRMTAEEPPAREVRL